MEWMGFKQLDKLQIQPFFRRKSQMSCSVKRQKLDHHNNDGDTAEERSNQDQSLLPGLPDHVSHLCLSLVPPSTLSAVCRPWRRLIYSPDYPPFPSLYAVFSLSDTQTTHLLSDTLRLYTLDPVTRRWIRLPPPPPSDPPLRLLIRHPAFISRKLPVQSVTVSGKLALLAATTEHFLPALDRPLLFDPIAGNWTNGPPIAAPRRWCAAGALGGTVYVASGIGSHYETDVARSVEKWDLGGVGRRRRDWRWEKMGNLRDGKFCREAIEAVGWRGKLCMVNVKGDAAKEGIIYDAVKEAWEEMPEGMLAGWKGSAAAMAEETIYAVDESSGCLKMYDHVRDTWVELLKNDALRGAQQVAAAEGKVYVMCDDGAAIAVVEVPAAQPARICMIESPPGLQAVAIHVLPRWCHLESEV